MKFKGLKGKLICLSIIILILNIAFAIITFATKNSVCLSITITLGTILFHFLMRFFVAYSTPRCFKYDQKYFNEKPFEKKLYKALKVKKWKKYMPSYNPATYSMGKEVDLEAVANTTCRNEVIHSIIAVLSYIPLLFTIWFGAFFVFLITSIIASLFDTTFVIMQRYNRPRLVKLINRKK